MAEFVTLLFHRAGWAWDVRRAPNTFPFSKTDKLESWKHGVKQRPDTVKMSFVISITQRLSELILVSFRGYNMWNCGIFSRGMQHDIFEYSRINLCIIISAEGFHYSGCRKVLEISKKSDESFQSHATVVFWGPIKNEKCLSQINYT